MGKRRRLEDINSDEGNRSEDDAEEAEEHSSDGEVTTNAKQRKRVKESNTEADALLEQHAKKMNLKETGEWGEEEGLMLEQGEDVDTLQKDMGETFTPFNVDEEADAGLVESFEKTGAFHDEVDDDPWLKQLEDSKRSKGGAAAAKPPPRAAVVAEEYTSRYDAFAAMLAALPENVSVTAFLSQFAGERRVGVKKKKKPAAKKGQVQLTPQQVWFFPRGVCLDMGGKRSYHDLKFQKSLTTSFLDREKKNVVKKKKKKNR